MRLLVLGGTGWLGGAVVAVAVGRGHEVTCVGRGGTPAPPGARLVAADRDVDDGLSGLAGRVWDAVVDVSRVPDQVRRAVRDLAIGHLVLVSTVSVYARLRVGGDEQDEVVEPLDEGVEPGPGDYAAAKVACERAATAALGADHLAVVRPGLIGGPGDLSGRTGYWPWRFAHPAGDGGRVLVPDAPDLPTQVIDVRDLADLLLGLAERRWSGVLDAVGPPVPLGEHLAVARELTGTSRPVAVAPDRLLAHGVGQWAGPRSLPLWLDADVPLGARSGQAARDAGLVTRPLAETLRDTLHWELGRQVPHGAGLTDDEERELLAALG